MSDTFEGFIHDSGGQVFDVRNTTYGAKGNTAIVSGEGSISSGSATFTWTGGSFAPGDATKVITVQGAGASGAVLSTTIHSVTSPTTVVLNTTASTTVSGKDFAYGADDTAAIVSALTAAQAVNGKVLVPPGIYMIVGASNTAQYSGSGGPITFGQVSATGTPNWGLGGMLGAGGSPGSPASTVFLCADAKAGLLFNGYASYQGFMCDGNKIATAPLQTNALVSNAAALGGAYNTFIDVWSARSLGAGWTMYGSQNNTFYSCGSLDSATDGLYLDGGAGGLDFWNFVEAGSLQYGVHGDVQKTGSLGTYLTHTEDVRFYGGSFSSAASDPTGVSKVYLRGTLDWKFIGVEIVGDNLSGPTVDLAQGSDFAYAIDFTGSSISATPNTPPQNPGRACIQVAQSPANSNAYTFLTTDGVRFTRGDTSVYIEKSASYLYSAIGWAEDATTNGPVVASGVPDVDTLLAGRTGGWKPATLVSPWTGAISYRIGSDGNVELKGHASSSTGAAGTIFDLDSGYYPTSGPTVQLTAARSTGAPGFITITTAGVVAGSAAGAGVNLYVDGTSFAVN